LLSAKSANSFAIIPAAAGSDNTYNCSGKTKAVIYGKVEIKSKEEVEKIIKESKG